MMRSDVSAVLVAIAVVAAAGCSDVDEAAEYRELAEQSAASDERSIGRCPWTRRTRTEWW